MLQTNQQNNTILTAIKKVKNVYMKRGFNLITLLMDRQLKSLQGDLASLNITLNTIANDKNVPKVENAASTTCCHLNKCMQGKS